HIGPGGLPSEGSGVTGGGHRTRGDGEGTGVGPNPGPCACLLQQASRRKLAHELFHCPAPPLRSDLVTVAERLHELASSSPCTQALPQQSARSVCGEVHAGGKVEGHDVALHDLPNQVLLAESQRWL